MNALDIYVDVIDSSTPATVSEIFIIVFLFVLDVEIFPIRQVSIRYADQPLKSAVKSSTTEVRQDEKTSNWTVNLWHQDFHKKADNGG